MLNNFFFHCVISTLSIEKPHASMEPLVSATKLAKTTNRNYRLLRTYFGELNSNNKYCWDMCATQADTRDFLHPRRSHQPYLHIILIKLKLCIESCNVCQKKKKEKKYCMQMHPSLYSSRRRASHTICGWCHPTTHRK